MTVRIWVTRIGFVFMLLIAMLPTVLGAEQDQWYPAWLPNPQSLKGSSLSPNQPRWATYQAEVDALQAQFEQGPLGEDRVLFIGSSSIRRWASLAQDFPELAVINHGFGGSQISDSIYFADQLVFPVAPRAIVFFAGTNDINAGKTPVQVYRDYVTFVELVHGTLPDTLIFFISIGPAISRWTQRARQVEANQMIRAYTANDPRLFYIDIDPVMLGPDGSPRPELFISDGLHLSPQGYSVWTDVLRLHLTRAQLLPPGSHNGFLDGISVSPSLNGMRITGSQEVRIEINPEVALESLWVELNGVEILQSVESVQSFVLQAGDLSDGEQILVIRAVAGEETFSQTHRFRVEKVQVLRGQAHPVTGAFPIRVESDWPEGVANIRLFVDGDLIHEGSSLPVEVLIEPLPFLSRVSLGILVTTVDGVRTSDLLSLNLPNPF